MAKVERGCRSRFWRAPSRQERKMLVVIPKTSSHRWLPKSAPPSQVGPVVVAAVAAGSMAVAAGSMAVGVISIMRASPEQVTSALQVGTPLAQAVGKEGLGGDLAQTGVSFGMGANFETFIPAENPQISG